MRVGTSPAAAPHSVSRIACTLGVARAPRESSCRGLHVSRGRRLMEARRREAPCRDAVDPVPSIVGQIRQGVRVYALRQALAWPRSIAPPSAVLSPLTPVGLCPESQEHGPDYSDCAQRAV